MPPRSDDTPRRGVQPRRGTSRDLPPEETDDEGRGFGGIGDARAYTPRGRTVAERDQRTRSPRAGRNTDPFRPALQVLDGGRPQRGRRPDADLPDKSDKSVEGEGDAKRGSAAASRESNPPESRPREARQRQTTARESAARESKPREARQRQTTARESAARESKPREARQRQTTARESSTRETTARESATRENTTRESKPRTARQTTRGAKPGESRTGDAKTRTPRGRRPELVDDFDEDEDEFEGRARTRPGRGRPTQGGTGKGTRNGRPPGYPRTGKIVGEPPKLANSTRRLRIGAVVALALFCMIGIRLVVLQVGSSPSDAARLMELREDRLATVTLPAARGSILDRNGAVLAHSVEARFVAADPKLVKDPARIAGILSPMLGVAASELVPKMTPHNRPGGGESRFEYLAQGVDIGIGEKIANMDLPGIVVKQDQRRDVPGADLAANLIGFTGADNSGLEGLEARYDSLLRGTDGQRVFEIGKGDLNKPIPGGYDKLTAPQPGTSLQLTIDDDLQYEVQRILCEQAKKDKASISGAVVLDVQTGEVLAQASCPTYNAAKPEDYSPTDRQDVPSAIIADPGSVHKAFIFGAALQEGLITPNSVETIGPGIERGGYPFRDSHPQPKGTKITMPGILALSSNVGTILLADRLGAQRVYEYQQKFGLGKATDEGMPGEAPGKLLTPAEWSGSASGSVPIGMSVDATLIQMAAGYAAIANDGTYIQPHLIKSMISGQNGKVTPGPAPETHSVLSPNVAAELRNMMQAVVDDKEATGTQAAVSGYNVAGKTGTGKRLIDGQYTSYNYGSFIGMAPADHPRFVVAVSADVPHGSGGDVAAPAFSKMMQFALLQHKVPPSTTKPPTFKIHP